MTSGRRSPAGDRAAPELPPEYEETLGLLRAHHAWRAECLNLIASENAFSPSVLGARSSDLEQRYANYLGRDRAGRTYRGTRFVEQIEDRVDRQVKRVFEAEHVELRAISGQVAGVAVVAGLARRGDRVLELTRADGGHQVAGRMLALPLFDLEVHDLAFDSRAYNVDTPRALEQIDRIRPRFVILGSSYFLFPHPIAALAAAVHERGGLVVYDASHVLGLIAGKRFQRPLAEGADIVFGSTHKTFPGPQGGIIYGNDSDLIERVSVGVYPALVTNHHVSRMPAMAIALAEMERWGPEYAAAVIGNAQVLGEDLAEAGVRMVASEGAWTQSHTLLLIPDPSRDARAWTVALESAGIITSAVPLPADLGGQAIRIGSQEVTRRGAETSDMAEIAAVIARVLLGEDPERVAPDVAQLARRFIGIRWSVDARAT
jgi:glycine hydroxymethyltransferase